jgi:hypothetical protein
MAEITNTTPRVGALYAALDRQHDQIRAERAQSIKESARLKYRRKLEDLAVATRELYNRQASVLDLAGDSTFSIINSKTFNAEGFVSENAALAVAIHKNQEQLDVLSQDFVRLFGEDPNLDI